MIVTEGTATEPNYFQGLSKHIVSRYGGTMDVQMPSMDIHGGGRGTVNLVNAAEKMINRSHKVYAHVWVVFDKNEFGDFDEAVRLAEANGFEAAWSNQSFEYWLYLHFHFSDSALHRDQWCEKLDGIFRQYKIGVDGYDKALPDIFDLVTEYGSLKAAVSFAKRREEECGQRYFSDRDPCTNVHKLILQLKPYLLDKLA